jgi:hypothetical protein
MTCPMGKKQQADTTYGRYQISANEQQVYLIDTATGEMWMYAAINGHWIKMPKVE